MDQAQSADTAADHSADNWFTALIDSLYVIRVPLVMAIVTLIALTVPEQVQEVYRVLAQGRTQQLTDWMLALASLLILAVVLWQVAREFSYDYGRRVPTLHPVAGWILAWLPRIIATTLRERGVNDADISVIPDEQQATDAALRACSMAVTS